MNPYRTPKCKENDQYIVRSTDFDCGRAVVLALLLGFFLGGSFVLLFMGL